MQNIINGYFLNLRIVEDIFTAKMPIKARFNILSSGNLSNVSIYNNLKTIINACGIWMLPWNSESLIRNQ